MNLHANDLVFDYLDYLDYLPAEIVSAYITRISEFDIDDLEQMRRTFGGDACSFEFIVRDINLC
jgi:hypothetical protein